MGHPPPTRLPALTMVGGLWLRLLPLGSLPFRLNLLSAALAATTLLLLAEAAYTWAQSWKMSPRASRIGWLVAALTLGSAPTFWNQATWPTSASPPCSLARGHFWRWRSITGLYHSRSRKTKRPMKAP